MSLTNIRIGSRLYIGFGALVLLSLALASFAVWQLWAIQSQVDLLDRQSQNSVRQTEILSELHAARRGLLRYNFDQDEPSFAEAEQRLDSASKLLEISVRMGTNAGRR